MLSLDANKIDWEKMNNRVPAIIQDATTGKVLMLAYMDQAALDQTLSTKKVTFYSRSKNRLWTKGESSGNYLNLHDMTYDCDGDALLVLVKPEGPCCHQGTQTCFEKDLVSDFETFKKLEQTIGARSQENNTESYTSTLLASGLNRVSQKVGEEAVEVVVAALAEDDEALKNEVADLFFHVMLLLHKRALTMSDVVSVLKSRMVDHA